jgi:enterobactin synthetase component D
VLTADERAVLRRGPDADLMATVVFSAKESVYKAVYPRVRRILEFHEVHIDLDLPKGSFRARVEGAEIPGRFTIDDQLVLTAAFVTTAQGRA